MRLQYFTLILLVTLSVVAYSTKSNSNTPTVLVETNSQKAEKALLNYLQAGDNSNVTSLNSLMHAQYRVVYNDLKKNEVSTIDKATYLSLIEKKVFGGKARKVEIISQDIMGESMASFKVKTSSEGGVFFSYFSLIKLNGKWLILQDFIYMA